MKYFAVTMVLIGGLMLGSVAKSDVIAAVGAGLSFVTAVDGRSIDTEQPLSLRAGYRFLPADLYLEFNTYSAADGNATLYIARRHQEWIVWTRHLFNPEWFASPFVAAGAGLQVDQVQTTLGSTSTSSESGSPEAMASLAAGVRFAIWQSLDLQFEMRGSYAATNSPNPVMGGDVLMGWSF